ncbi:MAG: hypothetical protein R3A78_16400 [Polyangiales bacterium]
MAITVVACIVTIFSLRADLRYFVANSSPRVLGEASHVQSNRLSPEKYVNVAGSPMLAHTVEYRRAVSGARYVVFPLAGQRTIFVEMRAEDAENPERMAKREFTGRLVTFGELGGRYGEVANYLSDSMSLPVSSETFLVREGESPKACLPSFLLALLCALVIAMNLVLFARWFRPLPVRAGARVPSAATTAP